MPDCVTELATIPVLASPRPRVRIPQDIAVIGGGRWGQVYCRILTEFVPRVKRVHLVSRRNAGHYRSWLQARRAQHGSGDAEFLVWDSLESLFAATDVEAAIVANLPAEHFSTAMLLLDRGVHALVEKPFVPEREQAQALITLAEEQNTAIHVGHEFLVASYMYRFRELMLRGKEVAGVVTDATRVVARWHDVAVEARSGVLKHPDLTTSVVSDLFPHVLSQLTVLFGPQPVHDLDTNIADGGWSATMAFTFGTVPGHLSLTRTASTTDRRLTVITRSQTWDLDYSNEPPLILRDGERLNAEANGDQYLRPLNAQLWHFFRQIELPTPHFLQSAAANRHIFDATWRAEGAVLAHQRASLRTLVQQDTRGSLTDVPMIALMGLRQHLSLALLDVGLVDSPKNYEAIDRWVTRSFHIIKCVANKPFTAQSEIAAALDLNVDELASLNAALRRSELAQQLMLHDGYGSKYLTNTVVPLAQSGAIARTLDREHQYPFRVGIYAGVSCMFSCSFCGRHVGAKYDRADVPTGNVMLKQLFRDAPKDDPQRFYLSGGLEPLTNPGIGEIISAGKGEGFQLSLYTNAFMLTPQLLDRQPGLWDLNTLRISMYGVDEATAEAVTKRKGSFTQVIANAKSLLQERNHRGSDLKIGFNFVILPGQTAQVLRLAEVIADINRSAAGDGQIDFLTLRQDYRAAAEDLSGCERRELVSIFDRFEARRQQSDLAALYVDFGYSLQALRTGYIGHPLEMVSAKAMRPSAYPQISVVIDLLGDIYAYREAGFLDRPGAHRYVLGRVCTAQSFENVIRYFVSSHGVFAATDGDTDYFDIFDHVVTKALNQAEADRQFGIPFAQGPVAARASRRQAGRESSTSANAHFSFGARL